MKKEKQISVDHKEPILRPDTYFPKRRNGYDIDIFWCGNLSEPRGKNGNSDKWSFPPQMERFLREQCEGLPTLQLFGGKAKFGIRLDIDAGTMPHVIGDSFLPPFKKQSFHTVIIDPPYPPYMHLGVSTVRPLLMVAAWLATTRVIWFAPMWISSYRFLQLEKSYFVRVGDHCEPRMLQILRPTLPDDWRPIYQFTHGTAVKYNKWLIQPEILPFQERKQENSRIPATLEIDREIRNVLCCPLCHADLTGETEGLRCAQCLRVYPVNARIPVMLPSESLSIATPPAPSKPPDRRLDFPFGANNVAESEA